jgi:hypothetical protein
VGLLVWGVRLTPRTARRLAAAESASDLIDAPLLTAQDPAATQLRARYEHERARLHTASVSRAAARVAAQVPPAQLALETAADARARAEAVVPAGAVAEPPDRGLRLLLGVATIGEGWLTFSALELTMPEAPVPLLLASLVLAPLLVHTMRASGGIARRAAWRESLTVTDWIVAIGAPAIASIAALGIAWSRVLEVTGDARAAWLTSVGLQAVILAVAWLWGYRHDGGPLARLAAAQEAHTRAIGRVAQLEADASRLARRHAHRLEELESRYAATLAALRFFRRVYGVPSRDVASDGVSERVAALTPQWER